ncbi:MAG: hypothetical protein K2M31_04450 [Muribaculaceae bacterium]|nr:hypothetical protein [Muribaculaceae bacterium]
MQTRIFKMSQPALLAYLFRRHGKGWTIGLLAGLVVLLLISLLSGDLRFAILALIYVFILVPMIMAFLYFNYALHPDICFNGLPHFLRLADGNLEICMLPVEDNTEDDAHKDKAGDVMQSSDEVFPKPEDDADKKWNLKWNKTFDTEDREIDYFPPESELIIKKIPKSKIGRYEVGTNEIFLQIPDDISNETSNLGFIYLPSSAFIFSADFKSFIDCIYKSNSN